jgi:hypothetical protein
MAESVDGVAELAGTSTGSWGLAGRRSERGTAAGCGCC